MYVRRYFGWFAMLLGVAMLAACAGGSGSSGFDSFPRSENAAIQQALAEDRCVSHESLTICPAQETERSPTAAPTATLAPAPTRTNTFALAASPTAAPTGTPPLSGPAVILSVVSGAAGGEVQITASLAAGGALVSGVQNDIGFDPTMVSIASTPDGRPDCSVNAAIGKDATFTFLPEGCRGLDCMSVRALVSGLDNVDPIPDGSVLYVCTLTIAPAAFGRVPLPATNVLVSDPAAGSEPAVGVDGAVLIPPPQPTPSATFFATPTRLHATATTTPTGTPMATPPATRTPAVNIGLSPGVPIVCTPITISECEFTVPFSAAAFPPTAMFRVAVRQLNPLGSWTIDGEPALIAETDQQADYDAPVALVVADAGGFNGAVQVAVLVFVGQPPTFPTPSAPLGRIEVPDLTGTGAAFGFITGELSVQSAASPVP